MLRPPLEVVVVTYRSEGLIAQCLSSVERFAPSGTVVHVVDNASPDDTVGLIRREFPSVRVIEREDNAGFSVANNVALAKITAPYVLVLNPDAELAEGVIEHLIAEMEENPDIGVLGCRLLTADGTPDHAAKRFIPTPVEAAVYFLSRLVGKRTSRYTAPEVDEFAVGDVDAVNGAFMLVRKSAMDEVGLFDERYWMYAEDLDWCTRFRSAGWRVVYDGRVTAFHIKGGIAGIRSWKLNYEFHRSMAMYYRKHSQAPALAVAPVIMGIWVKFAITSIVDSVRRVRVTGSAPNAVRTLADVSGESRLVSVVIPSYNRAHLLPQAVASVLDQTYPTIEAIVVDDGSSDDTQSVAASLMEQDPRVRYLRLPHGGAPRARNAGVEAARGEFLAFQDTDDVWDPEFIRSLLPEVIADGNTVAFCSHRLVTLEGDESIVPQGSIKDVPRRLAFGNVISTQTALMRRSLFLAGDAFDEKLPRFQDWDLWLHFLTKGSVTFVHVPTVLATLHRQPDSISLGRETRRARALTRILAKYIRFFAVRPFALLWLLARVLLGPLRNAMRRLKSAMGRG